MNKKKRFTVRIHLRNGSVIKFRARSLEYKGDGTGNVTSYATEGMPVRTWWFRHRRPLYIIPGEIVAIETTGA